MEGFEIPELNKTSIPALSSGSLPAGDASLHASDAGVLFDWLGSFWSEVYSDPDFIKNLQQARALRAAQLYLDLLENLKLQDRSGAPVFHRERWHPIVLRRSRRNTGSKGMFKLTSEKTANPEGGEEVPVETLGMQKATWLYGKCASLTLGGVETDFKGMVVYPLEGGSAAIKSIPACACNSIAGATVVLGSGTDFAVLDGAIAFAESQDPFEGEHASEFPKFEVRGEDGDPDSYDEETVVWACDALFDKNFIYRHLGYAVGLKAKSSEMYKVAVNAAWNALSSGSSPLLFRALMASICGVPTVKNDGEKVERIDSFGDGSIQVVTTKEVYMLPTGSVLRPNVVRGASLERFDTLDMTVRVYACPSDFDKEAVYGDFAGDFEEFMDDVPSMDLPPAMFKTDLEHGFSIGWDPVDVEYCGPDANGNPRIRFPLGGSGIDEDRFWTGIWARYEDAGVSMETCLEGIEHGNIPGIGETWCRISPMAFFMRNLVGANTVVVTVRTDAVPMDAPLYDPAFFRAVRDGIPAYVRLYVVEHSPAHAEEYDAGTMAQDSHDEFADVGGAEDFASYAGYPHPSGRRRRGSAGYRDRVSSKWVAACRDDDGYDDL